jgi:hypothetical protein
MGPQWFPRTGPLLPGCKRIAGKARIPERLTRLASRSAAARVWRNYFLAINFRPADDTIDLRARYLCFWHI